MATVAHPDGSERKIVTVLFADLVGSTAMADEEDPERIRQVLERFYDLTTVELEAAGGTIEKFAGDAVMAVFGSPIAQEDHAARALHAALAIRERSRIDLGGTLELRIGVDSGEVLVSAARAGSAFLSGDTVNMAARLEQSAAPGQILVGARTASLARSGFRLAAGVPLTVKGKRDPVLAHELLEAVLDPPAVRVAALAATFVGREDERAGLLHAWDDVRQSGDPVLLTIVGEPGIGKTSLARHAVESIADQEPAPIVRSGRCLAYGQGSTYWPLAEILREHFGIPRTATAETVLERLAGRETLGLTFGLAVAEDLHPLAARERHHDAWISLLEEVAATSAVCLVVEDVHWAEEPLLDLLAELVHDVRGPLLLLTTARPELIEAHPTWAGGRRRRTVWLEPLSVSDAGAMVHELLGDDPPPTLGRLVVERADGNPFFVEELLGALIDRGVLHRDDGRWILDEALASSTPDSVRAVIAARLDLLEPLEKAGLQAAAVAGRTFSSTAVVDLLGGDIPDFRVLEERGFIGRVAHPSAAEREYTFKHALTRDVAYAGVPKVRRAHLHAAFAERLERIGETGDQFAFLLAHHYAEAVRSDVADIAWSGQPELQERLTVKAVEWLYRAGVLAAGRFAIDDGLGLLQRALALAPTADVRARILRAIGRAHALRYAGPEAIDAYKGAIEATTDVELRAEVYAELALEVVQRFAMFNPMPSRALVDGWIGEALALSPPDSDARARAFVARAMWTPESREAAGEAIRIADAVGDINLLSQAYGAAACVAFATHRYDESIAWATRRLEMADRISDPDHQVDIVGGMIPGLLGRGDITEARRYADLHDEAAARLSTHHQVHAVAMKLELEELTARWDSMRGLEARTVGVVEANVTTPCVRNARSLLACALAETLSGDDERSRELEAEAVELEMAGYAGSLAPLRIRLALGRGELDRLGALIAVAVPPPPAKNWWSLNTESARLDGLAALGDRAAVEAEAPAFLVEGTYLEPFALRALGIVRDDAALLGRAVERFDAMGVAWHAAATRRVLDGSSDRTSLFQD